MTPEEQTLDNQRMILDKVNDIENQQIKHDTKLDSVNKTVCKIENRKKEG